MGYKGSMWWRSISGDGSGFIAPDGTPITVHYAYEEELLGTAGAIKNAGRFVTEDSFFVLNADTFYQIDYSRLVTMQRESDLDMALVLRKCRIFPGTEQPC
ncbi:MAG: sugar phosphate nucleotidyltransferase [Clostridium sp.]